MGKRPQRSREAYPGFGLVMGAALGLIVGLLFLPDVFFLGAGVGAMGGLILGAIIDLRTR